MKFKKVFNPPNPYKIDVHSQTVLLIKKLIQATCSGVPPIVLFEKREKETAKKKRLLQCIKNVYAAKEYKMDDGLRKLILN